ncbi:MAG: AI-2E family transporter [Chloroflexi bacterium]|nr:AI-2E family transporter [Chloroflexota bacterium]
MYLALLLLLVWILFSYRALISPLIIASLLAYLLNPAVNFLKTRLSVPHSLAVYLVFIVFILGGILLGIYLVPLVIRQAQFVSAELSAFPGRAGMVDDYLKAQLGFDLALQQRLMDLQTSSSQLLHPERVFQLIRAASTNVVWVGVILVATFYLLKDWEHLRDGIFSLAPDAEREQLQKLHSEIKAIWQAYLRGQILLMTSVGVLTWLGAMAIGLRGAVLLGLTAGFLDIIPSVGPVVAAGVAALIAGTQGSTYLPLSNLWFVVLVVGMFTLIQTVENIWLQPQIMHRQMKLHPAIVFIAVVSSLTLVGALLALIIIPFLGTLIVILNYARTKRRGAGREEFEISPSSERPAPIWANEKEHV